MVGNDTVKLNFVVFYEFSGTTAMEGRKEGKGEKGKWGERKKAYR